MTNHSIPLKRKSKSRQCRQYPGFGRFQNGEDADSGGYSGGGKGLRYPQRYACCQVSCLVLSSLLSLHYSAVTTCPRRWTSTSTRAYLKQFELQIIFLFKELAELAELATQGAQQASSTRGRMPDSLGRWLR